MRRHPQEQTPADLKARADRLFKIKEAQRLDAPHATADYRAAGDAALQRMKRLRAERLAREAKS